MGAIRRRIPGVCVSEDCALDRVLELWFAAPDEFLPSKQHGDGPSPTVAAPVKAPADPPAIRPLTDALPRNSELEPPHHPSHNSHHPHPSHLDDDSESF